MNDQTKQYQQLIAKCWADEVFKQRLLADPAGTLKAEGFALPEGVTVTAVEDTAQHFTLVIPHRLTELSDEALEGVSGGTDLRAYIREHCPDVWSVLVDGMTFFRHDSSAHDDWVVRVWGSDNMTLSGSTPQRPR